MYSRTFVALVLLVTVLGVECTTEEELQELLMRFLYPAQSPAEERHVDKPEARSLSAKVESLLDERGKVSCRKSLPKEKICDFVGDCPDWKDEQNCEKKYKKKGGCQALIFLKDCDFCDGFTDCADNSDEENCPAGTPTCLAVIPDEWICDGWRHCYDWSDELNCEDDQQENNGGDQGGNNDGDQGGNNNGGETQNCNKPPEQDGNRDFEDFMQQMLDAHNYYRCLHNVGPLEESTELEYHAQSVSDVNAYDGYLKHSSGSDFGENLWYKGSSSNDFGVNSITGLEVVKDWYDEISDYDFDNPGFSGATGHFTQVVWKETTHVGCSYSPRQDAYSNVYVACNYSPRGNWRGEFAENVLPLGDSNASEPETNNDAGAGDGNTDSDQDGNDGGGGGGACNKPPERDGNNGIDDFMQQMLDAHNYHRCLHNVGPLEIANKLADHAQAVSKNNSYYGYLKHSSDTNYGENLWYKGSSGEFGLNSITGLEVVKDWYDEILYYDFGNPGFSGQTGHFTQVVWKDTKKLGCGYSQSQDSTYTYVFVACNYKRAGNYLSEFAENVLPPSVDV